MSCLLCDLSDQLWVSCRPLVSLEIRITGDPCRQRGSSAHAANPIKRRLRGRVPEACGGVAGAIQRRPLSTAWDWRPTWFQPRCARAVAVKGTLNSMCVGPAIGVDTVRKGIMIRPVQSWKRETNDEFTSAAGCANQPRPHSHDANTKAKRGTSNAGVSDPGRDRQADRCHQVEPMGTSRRHMILVAYRAGLRSSELTDLPWDQIDSIGPPWPSAGPKPARLQCIQFSATSCGYRAGCK